MNRTTIIFVAAALALFAAGTMVGIGFAGRAATAPSQERRILFYRNPMNPAITSPTPAKDEMGMDYLPVYEGEEPEGEGEPLVTVAPEIANNLGVRTEAAVRGELSRRVETVGYVGYDEHRMSHVHLRAEGWIEELHLHAAGERVHSGDLLFLFYSPELVTAQEEFVQAIEAQDRRLVDLSRRRLAVLGIPPSVIAEVEQSGQVRQRLPIYASQNGVVAELKVREGMFVGRDMEVMTLADLGSVWLLVDLFEQQAAWVREGRRAEVRLAAMPGRVWQGRVEYIYPDVDPQSRTLRVRLRFDNPGAELKPNMYAQATLFADPRPALSVPRDAVIRTGQGAHVIAALGEGRFRPVEVRTGIESGERVEILEGLREGDRVVVSAQFLIDSEASLRAALRRMTAPAAMQAGTLQPAGGGDLFTATGTLNAVEPSSRKVNITHDPIPALGWPAMTMEFAVAQEVPLGEFKPGAHLEFELRRIDPVTYEVAALRAQGGGQ